MDYARQAKCKWPKADIDGTGRYASVSRCQCVTTAKLFGTLAEAEEAKVFIDGHGCGRGCGKDHLVSSLGRECGARSTVKDDTFGSQAWHASHPLREPKPLAALVEGIELIEIADRLRPQAGHYFRANRLLAARRLEPVKKRRLIPGVGYAD
jgi:hypothetical protein